MMFRTRTATGEVDGGFTLIELLVVMIVIGILAAIAIPAFLSQKSKAKETSAKADVTTIGKEIAAYYVDGTIGLTIESVDGVTWTLKEQVAPAVVVSSGRLSSGNRAGVGPLSASSAILSGTRFCVQVQNGSTSAWHYSAANGLVKGNCAATDV